MIVLSRRVIITERLDI